MKLTVDRICIWAQGCARTAVILLAVLAIIVSGAGAAGRLLTDQTQPVIETETKLATLDAKADPEEASGEMATGGHPWTEQPCFWQAIPALAGGSDQSRLRLQVVAPRLSIVSQWTLAERQADIQGSISLVNARLGHRFTLVGSRPSGTS